MSDKTETELLARKAIERDLLLSAVSELAVLLKKREVMGDVLGHDIPKSLSDEIERTAGSVMELIRPSSKIAAR
jgi:hypothetical protein